MKIAQDNVSKDNSYFDWIMSIVIKYEIMHRSLSSTLFTVIENIIRKINLKQKLEVSLKTQKKKKKSLKGKRILNQKEGKSTAN